MALGSGLVRLTWQHPVVGEVSEVACPAHDVEVRRALAVLGIGCFGSDGSVDVPGFSGPGDPAACLRCQAGPGMPPRVLLRQWFGKGGVDDGC